MRNVPEERVTAWLDRQAEGSIWTTSVTVLEIETWLQILPLSEKRSSLSLGFEKLLDRIDHRVAAFDEASARMAVQLMGSRKEKGIVMEMRDTMIAGIVLANHATLATRNVAHFSDIAATVVDPWTDREQHA